MTQAVFGKIVTGAHVQAACIETLKFWLPTYLAEVERQTGSPPQSIPMVRSWETNNEFKHWPEEQVPCAVVISPGTIDKTMKRGDSKIQAKWMLGIAVVVSAKDKPSTYDLAQKYAGAVRAALLQNPSMGGLTSGITWQNERYDDVPNEDTRTLAACQVIFEVEVVNAAYGEKKGLLEPPDDPYSPDPDLDELETAAIGITKEEL